MPCVRDLKHYVDERKEAACVLSPEVLLREEPDLVGPVRQALPCQGSRFCLQDLQCFQGLPFRRVGIEDPIGDATVAVGLRKSKLVLAGDDRFFSFACDFQLVYSTQDACSRFPGYGI